MKNSGKHPSATQRVLSHWLSIVLVTLLLLAVGAVYATTRRQTVVRIVSPSWRDIETTVSTVGTVVPANDFPARANFSGVVEKIYVHLGEKVHAGQLLVRMKDQYAMPRLVNARAALEEAEVSEQNVAQNGSQEDHISSSADLVRTKIEQAQAARALDAMNKIASNGSVSQAELGFAAERLRIANANLEALNRRISARYSPQDLQSWKDRVAASKATLAAEKVSWGNANITTPIDGTIYVLPVNLYDFAPAGADLLHVADLSHIEVQADFQEPDVSKLYTGQPVRVTWDGEPQRVWHGHVRSKPLSVTRGSAGNVGRCIIALDDGLGELPLGTRVVIVAVVQKRSHALVVPREALRTEGADHFVYRDQNGQLERTSVETGLTNPMDVEITKGLGPQDTVVLHSMNNQELMDHMKVKAER